jgi:hypothetical protein
MSKPVLMEELRRRSVCREPDLRANFHDESPVFSHIKERILFRLFDRTRLLGPALWRAIRT